MKSETLWKYSVFAFLWCGSQEVKNNPVFLITEDDLKPSSLLIESSAPSKKEKREAERRKKASGWLKPPHLTLHTQTLWSALSLTVCLPEGSGSVKAGGGGNAREIRIRKTKKKGRKDEDSDEETGPSQQSTLTAKTIFYLHWDIMSLYAH